jgi:3-hydroxy-9,10-secoandrosta-1,3,5(10)-triene-9,17-dione monooxygenase reductase component
VSDESTSAPAIDPALFRAVLGRWASGVTVITALDGGEPVGMAASSFTSLSLEPAFVLFCAAHNASAWPRIQRTRAFCVNILASDQELVSRQMAGKGDRFADITWTAAVTGSPVIDGVLGWIDCRVEAEHDGGDHVIVVGRVEAMGFTDGAPLMYFRGGYHSLDVAG